MGTVQDLLEVAKGEIGTKESPPDSNCTKYGRWYGLDGNPWCDMFVSWCAYHSANEQIGRFAYVPDHEEYFRNRGEWCDRNTHAQPGDIVIFGNGDTACHIGIVEYQDGDTIVTIEGNTEDVVARRYRTKGSWGSSWYIRGYGHPAYSTNWKDDIMSECIIRPDEKPYLVYICGGVAHGLAHPDEAVAIREMYKKSHGEEIPEFSLGTKSAPFGWRLYEALQRPWKYQAGGKMESADVISAIIRSIVGTGALALLGFCAKSVRDIWKSLKIVKDAQRTMLKNQIVREYERADNKGYITTLRLETCERAFENYKALDGNSYVADLMDKIRKFSVIPTKDIEIANNTKEGV